MIHCHTAGIQQHITKEISDVYASECLKCSSTKNKEKNKNMRQILCVAYYF